MHADKKKVALIGTGGSISIVGRGPLDLFEYGDFGDVLEPDELLERFPAASDACEVIPIRFRAVPSPRIGPKDWADLADLISHIANTHKPLAGIVITHGTSTMEETAYFLNLVCNVAIPIVLVGAQRAPTGLSSDAGLNLLNAIRVAMSKRAQGMGVLVLMNDEIHAAREVVKNSTHRLQAFNSQDLGILGYADPDGQVVFYRAPTRRHAPDTDFVDLDLETLPRVDIALSYAGADGTAVEAILETDAKAIIVSGFAPSYVTPDQSAALDRALRSGVLVIQSTRSGSGRVLLRTNMRERGIIVADNLPPQKARILAMLALKVTEDPSRVQDFFYEY